MDEDNERMHRLALGDVTALEELIARHRDAAERYARSILHDDALAEDVVQEAFARLYLCREDYSTTAAFRPWLNLLVRHLCIDQLRRMKRVPVPLPELPDSPAPSAEAEYLRFEGQMRLWDLLSALPQTEQQLLTGYALEGLSYRELAQRLHLSLPQVRIRLHRLRKRLREKEDAE